MAGVRQGISESEISGGVTVWSGGWEETASGSFSEVTFIVFFSVIRGDCLNLRLFFALKETLHFLIMACLSPFIVEQRWRHRVIF